MKARPPFSNRRRSASAGLSRHRHRRTCTRPTGFSAVPPSGPAMPVTASASSARCAVAAPRRPSPRPSASRHRAMRRRCSAGGHAEHLDLGLVGIGDEAAVEHRGGPGNVGQRRGDHAARAGFGRRHHDAPALAGAEQCRSARRVDVPLTPAPRRRTRRSPWRSRRCLRSRPMKPSLSLVVALTETRSAGNPEHVRDRRRPWRRDAARPAAPRRSASRRALAIRPPRARTIAAACADEEARGRALPLRIGGREMRADVAVAAGRESASVSACSATSASEWPVSLRSCGMLTPQSVTPVARARKHGRRSRCRCARPESRRPDSRLVGHGDILAQVSLMLSADAVDDAHRQPGPFGDRRVVGEVVAARR